MEEVPLNWMRQSWRDWRRGAGSRFQRRRKAYWKERSVICKENDVDGRAWQKMKSECCEEAELRWGYADDMTTRNELSLCIADSLICFLVPTLFQQLYNVHCTNGCKWHSFYSRGPHGLEIMQRWKIRNIYIVIFWNTDNEYRTEF